ncbi:MAG: hypothetical protein LDL41_06035, partial [Coleofasciculus sp. S288]|nr:hypothetical protein [Coleofasciculus sp. S288]
SEKEQQILVRLYASNPLMLKIVTTTIQDIFDGDTTRFLTEGGFVFGDIRELLDQQFNRLSALERQVMYGFAIHHEVVTLPGWPEELIPSVSSWERIEAVESLQRRSLIEKKSSSFTQQPMIRIYVAQKLTEQMEEQKTPKTLYPNCIPSHSV